MEANLDIDTKPNNNNITLNNDKKEKQDTNENNYEDEVPHKYLTKIQNKLIQLSRNEIHETMVRPVYRQPVTHNILILADQQGRNLSLRLGKLLGSNYKVKAICKPGARLYDVLFSTRDDVAEYTKNDFVIILAGINDDNPCNLQCHLNSWLQYVNHTNVIISEVPYNRNLRECKLNYYELRFICQRHPNTTYLDMDYNRNIPFRQFFTTNLCRSLLRETLRLNHITYYITLREIRLIVIIVTM